ncbi:MAG: hypothetical protein GY807_01925 [Gammaproteobacteria bacterium]|nr:hypothetical protein [Gammaproteobacteria bacterium]
MTWFWISSYDERFPIAEDSPASPDEFHSGLIAFREGKLEERQDSPLYTLKGPNKKFVYTLHELPSATRCPLVSQEVCNVISELVSPDQIQYLRAIVKWETKAIQRYSFARPLVWLDALEIDKCEIGWWSLPNISIGDYTYIALKPDCLQGHHYVRIRYLKEVLISDVLKHLLEQFDDGSMCFVRPEDLQSALRR